MLSFLSIRVPFAAACAGALLLAAVSALAAPHPAASPHAAGPAAADPLVWLEQKVTASDGVKNDVFGASVAIAGNLALVGAPDVNLLRGKVYAFAKSGGAWVEVQEFTASDVQRGDQFGYSVAISGTTAVVGAPGANFGGGAGYVFTESGGTWSQVQKLSPTETNPLECGRSVALSPATILMGAPAENSDQYQGEAFVFTESGGTWSEAQQLQASDGAAVDNFGVSVALSEGNALIGALNAAVGGSHQGAAYLFGESNGTWSQTQKLTASDGAAQDDFGAWVSLDGATALVGAPGASVNGNAYQGAAYVYEESGGSWTQTQKLTASDGAANDDFGAVTLAGDTALVGARGAVYLFADSGGTWTQTEKVTPSDGPANISFGWNNAIDDGVLLAGCELCNVGTNGEQGAAYFYQRANLGLAVDAPGSVARQGDAYVSQAVATNDATATSPAVAVTLAVPAAATFVSASATQGSCENAAGVVTCSFGQIAGGGGTAAANVTLRATGGDGTTIDNTASVAGARPPLGADAPTLIQTSDQPPVAQDGTLATRENVAASGTLEATDPDGNPLQFDIVTAPRHGSVTLDDAATGAYTYTPDAGYTGADRFTFKAGDGILDSNTATVSVTVTAAGGSGGGGGLGPASLALLALALCAALAGRRRRSL